MKIECQTALLRNAVQLLQPVCPLRTTMPILSNLLVKAASGQIELVATDLDLTVKTKIPADIVEEGETTIPVRFFLDALRKMNSDTIEISVDEANVSTIRSGNKVKCSLRGMDPSSFANFPVVETDVSIELPTKDLSTMLKYTSYAVSKDESKSMLNGVCFNFSDDLDVVATDGKRLAKYVYVGVKQEKAMQVIVPTKSISVIQQILNTEGTAEIKYTANLMQINTLNSVLVTRLVDEHYPNYNQVIPKSCQAAIEVNRSAFLNAIGLATVVTEKSKQAVVRLKFEKNQLAVSANTAEIGEVNDVLEIKYDGEQVDLALNPTYLTDVCQSVDSEEITIEISGSGSPLVIRSGENFLCIIMPMRV